VSVGNSTVEVATANGRRNTKLLRSLGQLRGHFGYSGGGQGGRVKNLRKRGREPVCSADTYAQTSPGNNGVIIAMVGLTALFHTEICAVLTIALWWYYYSHFTATEEQEHGKINEARSCLR
jgi:hypothetical protein